MGLVVTGMTPEQEAAFAEFVRAHATELLRYARWLIPDAAESEDALQMALLRVARHWSQQLAAPEAYARVVLRNLATDRARRAHLVATPAELPEAGTPSGPDPAEAVAAQAQLDHVLAALPSKQRTAVVLRVLEGLSAAETAAVMGCAVGTVKSNLSRGLRAAERMLAHIESAEVGTWTV